MISDYRDLDLEQNITKIQIQSPTGTKTLSNISYKEIHEAIQQEIIDIADTKFYNNVKVHLGATSDFNRQYYTRMRNKKKNMAQKRLIIEEKYLHKLMRANTQAELQSAQKLYNQDIEILDYFNKVAPNVKFTPKVLIEADKKMPFYAYYNQHFNMKGIGVASCMVGYRSVLTNRDSVELSFQSPLANLQRKYYNIQAKWNLPKTRDGNFTASVSKSNSFLFKNIDQKYTGATLSYEKQNQTYQLEHAYRQPTIFSDLIKQKTSKFYLPSWKLALKYSKIYDNIELGDVTSGSYSSIKTQLGIPVLSQSQFFNIEYKYRKFYEISDWSKKLPYSETLKKMLMYSNLETNFSFNFQKLMNEKPYVSNLLQNIDVRGFDANKNPCPTSFQAKTSIKLNCYNFPLLREVRIIPFLYAQLGISRQCSNRPKWAGMAASGMGLSYYLNKSVHLQVLYNLAQIQRERTREPVNFQIRIGVLD